LLALLVPLALALSGERVAVLLVAGTLGDHAGREGQGEDGYERSCANAAHMGVDS
jgi:hypothetical protein